MSAMVFRYATIVIGMNNPYATQPESERPEERRPKSIRRIILWIAGIAVLLFGFVVFLLFLLYDSDIVKSYEDALKGI